LRNDLRLGQVVIIPNFGCHPRLNPRSIQHEPLRQRAVAGRVEKKPPASRHSPLNAADLSYGLGLAKDV
jgi:hypothetical protein